MPNQSIVLVAGLGNPGAQYADTRHNVAHWFIQQLQQQHQISFKMMSKFKGEVGHLSHNEQTVRVIVPNTYMNLSGQSVAPLAAFYQIPAQQILVIHDELDLAPGVIRLKIGGGHGGHNGLRDISTRLGSGDYNRIRIGIGHPGSANSVSGYVLSKPSRQDRQLIQTAIANAIKLMPKILSGDFPAAMNQLHSA